MEFRRRKNPAQQTSDEVPKKRRKEEKCFEINEKILCFEPDEKLEKVLYDAKIRDVQEIIRKGKKCYEYLVHFQGWNSSWDRKVCEDFILKDTPENRKLQRELAEKKQLQLGAYLYRKERKKRKKLIERSLLCASGDTEDGGTGDAKKPLDAELYFSSSTTESHDDDRVFLHIGEILKRTLEFDHQQVTRDRVYAQLPSPHPVVAILEDFVRDYALKVLTRPPQEPLKPKKLALLGRTLGESRVKPVDYDAIVGDIGLCKEIADGLRVYFNFILDDFLLYPDEKVALERVIAEAERNFGGRFVPAPRPTLLEFLTRGNVGSAEQETSKRISRLRSHSLKTDEEERPPTENLSSMASTSSNDSFMPERRANLPPKLTPMSAKIMEDVLGWHLIDCEASAGAIEPAMIFGVHHLSRLIVKLPEFLSATPMSEEKITVLLKYLDAFVEFMEENSERYGAQGGGGGESEDAKVEVKDEEATN